MGRGELDEYEKSKYLQGRYIPICYGIATLDCRAGLVLEDCGQQTLEHPPENENEKFLLYLRAMCTMERCLAAGLVHQDAGFRNPSEKPQDVWAFMDLDFSTYSRYQLDWLLCWGLCNILRLWNVHGPCHYIFLSCTTWSAWRRRKCSSDSRSPDTRFTLHQKEIK